MLNVKVPAEVGVLGRPGIEGWHSVVDIGTLIVASLDEKSLVAGEG